MIVSLTRQAWDLVVVLEEDALVVAGFHRRLREVLCDLPATWDMLYLNAHHAGNLSVTPRDPRHATEQVTRGALLYKVARTGGTLYSRVMHGNLMYNLGRVPRGRSVGVLL